MKKFISILLCALILMSMGQSALAYEYYVGQQTGWALYTDIIAQINGHDIASFNINGNTAVVAEDLRNYGFDVRWNEATRSIHIDRIPGSQITSTYIAAPVAAHLIGQPSLGIYYTDIKAYVNGNLIASNNIGGKTAVLINDLSCFGIVEWNQSERKINLTMRDPNATPSSGPAKIGDVIGNAVYTDIVAQINGYDIASFNINGNTAVVAEDLRNYGFNVEWNEQNRALYIKSSVNSTVVSNYVAPPTNENIIGNPAHNILYTDIKTYVEGTLVDSFNINGSTVIYMNDLKVFGEVKWDPDAKIISLTGTRKDNLENCYPGTNIPSYTKITDVNHISKIAIDQSSEYYVYPYSEALLNNYFSYFKQSNEWTEISLGGTEPGTVTFYNSFKSELLIVKCLYDNNQIYVYPLTGIAI